MTEYKSKWHAKNKREQTFLELHGEKLWASLWTFVVLFAGVAVFVSTKIDHVVFR